MAAAVLHFVAILVVIGVALSTKVKDVSLSKIARRWGPGGPCQRTDALCMNRVALIYANRIRAAAGRAPYEMGTLAMFENALAHSKRMAGRGRLFHQSLKGLNQAPGFQCKSFISGENVAQNYVPFDTSKPTDPAYMCMQQWKNSPGHYRNIISTYHKFVVVGVYIDSKHLIWCTQLFASTAAFGSGKCAKATGSSSARPPAATKQPSSTPSPSPSPSPSKVPPTPRPALPTSSYTFKYRYFYLRTRRGRRILYGLRCATYLVNRKFTRVCRYCQYYNSRVCFSVTTSIRIDKYLRFYYG